MKLWIVFALSAALFWGTYVPTLGIGQLAFGGRTNPNSSMRAFLFIGFAYFVLAILIPGIWLLTHSVPATQDPGFNMKGAIVSTLAGCLGALGALSIVFALKYSGGNARYVAPVVFAGAPIISVLVAWIIDIIKEQGQRPNIMFIIGLITSVIGVSLVLYYSPAVHAPTPTPTSGPAIPEAASSSQH